MHKAKKVSIYTNGKSLSLFLSSYLINGLLEIHLQARNKCSLRLWRDKKVVEYTKTQKIFLQVHVPSHR